MVKKRSDRWQLTREQWFWARVNVDGDCWIWEGTAQAGYGRFSGERAHRVAWRLHTGVDAGDRHVLHSCDVKLCVRPDHLHLGDHAMNMREAAERGRLRQRPDCGHPQSSIWLMSNGRLRCRDCHAAQARRRKSRAEPL